MFYEVKDSKVIGIIDLCRSDKDIYEKIRGTLLVEGDQFPFVRIGDTYDEKTQHFSRNGKDLHAAEIRKIRNDLLRETDYRMTVDFPSSTKDHELWKRYRQALRDIPQQPSFPYRVTWPERPKEGEDIDNSLSNERS